MFVVQTHGDISINLQMVDTLIKYMFFRPIQTKKTLIIKIYTNLKFMQPKHLTFGCISSIILKEGEVYDEK